MRIRSVTARQILDCKARPLVEVEVATDNGIIGRGAAPTGSSVGAHEAYVLRDGDPSEYGGLSVHRAVKAVNEVIGPELIGHDVADQPAIDEIMNQLDGTEDKSRLGGNSIYSTSIAVLRAAAACAGLPVYQYLRVGRQLGSLNTVPVPSFNMINGGRYGEILQPFNEFIVMPYRADTIEIAVEQGIKLFHVLGDVLRERLGHAPQVASSYGFAAPSADPRIVLGILREAADRAGSADIMGFALDCASSEMYDADTDTYELLGERVSSAELITYTRDLAEEFPLIFVEDLLDEDDWAGYTDAVTQIDRTLILGDDLIVTNRERLERAARTVAVDGFILKPNQVGTITDALACFDYATSRGLIAVPSGRSGGVIDDIVMDLSVGLEVPFQKNGAPRSGERIEKLNFLMRAAEAPTVHGLADVSKLVRF